MEFHNKIVYIPIKTIIPNQYNSHTMLKSTYTALKDNIQQNGFIGAILVRQHPLKKGKYEIIDGEKRYRILRELKQTEIPVIILEYNDINSTINMIRFNREHGYFDKEKTKAVIDDLIKKTNKLFVREILHTGLKEFDDLIDDNPEVFGKNEAVNTSKYSNILQKSEKSKKLFY